MNVAVMQGILNLLMADTTLTGLLGAASIFPGWIQQGYTLPCITVTENNETSRKRVGYTHYGHRDQEAVVQIDAWTKESYRACETLMNRVETTLIPDSVADTRGWEKIGESISHESDIGTYHGMARFRFKYNLED